MTKHGSASPRKQESRTLDANLKRRARKLATDSRVDPRTRSLIRYGLQIQDEYLEQIVNRVEAGEMRIDHIRLDSD
jgi:5-methylcytosine-specific restriction endonuclease McrA